MIQGVVNAHHEAVVRVPLVGPSGRERNVDAVIDTGFNGFLTLPPALVEELGLEWLGQKSMVLANGSRDVFDTYGVAVVWDGQTKFVDADEANAAPLLGMAMLHSHNLNIDVVDGGRVLIDASAGRRQR